MPLDQTIDTLLEAQLIQAKQLGEETNALLEVIIKQLAQLTEAVSQCKSAQDTAEPRDMMEVQS